MKVSKDKLLKQSEKRTITEMAELYNVSYGTMWKILHKIGYKPKAKNGRLRTIIEVVD